MRLIDIKRSINLAKESFNYKTSESNGYRNLEGIQQLKVALRKLYKIKYNKDERIKENRRYCVLGNEV